MSPELDMSVEDGSQNMEGACQEDEHVQQGTCVACSAGTRRAAGDDPSSGDTMCEAIVCEEDFHVVAHQCMACAPGFVRAAGDEASGEDTSCEAVLCAEDEFVFKHACMPCASGRFNQAGDDASQGDTMCEPERCAENERVSQNQCVPCEPGTIRPAGDEASQEDTACEAVLCAENQRVQDHECVACATGLTRPAGDAASGEDTLCTRWETPLFMSETHTCARMPDRTLKCWGRNNAGQLGLGTQAPAVQSVPAPVPGLSNVTDVSIGHQRSCVIVDPGQVKCWGAQGFDAWLGVESTDTFVSVPFDVRGESSVASLDVPNNGRRTCIIRNTGEVACWGSSSVGATGRPESARWSNVVSNVTTAIRVELNNGTSCVSLVSGQVACWGANNGLFANGSSQDSLSAQESSYPSPVLDFGLGNSHVCALLDTREVWCSGNNVEKQINASDDSTILSPFKTEGLGVTEQLAVSLFFNCARGNDEKVRCWGTFPEGTVYESPQTIGNLDGARDIQVGYSSGCALLGTGEVACWGRNDKGQLGDGTRTNSVGSATRVSGIDNAVAIHVGPYRACALLADGQIMCWGNNEYGVLGDGTNQDRKSPVVLTL